jgi:hypothetical protein
MSDVNNPGLVSVANEVYGNPDPNGGSELLIPLTPNDLTSVADQGFAPAGNGVDAHTFPTPSEVTVTQVPTGQRVLATFPPHATEVIVDDQVIGQGDWVYVDPLNPALGKKFVTPGEFLVVGPSTTIQTNLTEATQVVCTVTAVYDADNLWHAPSASTTRFLLVVAPPALNTYPVSIQGREIVFAEDTITTANQGAVRIITGFQPTYIVINKEDPTDETTPSLADPVIGDTFVLDVQREGAQDIVQVTTDAINVIILPPPPNFVPNPGQALINQGTVDISTGLQPGKPIVTSGTQVPTAITVEVANQATSVGLPTNIFI